MRKLPLPQYNNRLGFHYFPDTLHYRDQDLEVWLPELKTLGSTWLTLVAPNSRAIPESFIKGILSVSIEPVLHFHLPLDPAPCVGDVRLLLETYARWGVHYTVLFDRPNIRSAWSPASWVQNNLVERFLDNYIPLAQAALECGLIPVFPPLEPGGDYWDTAFLRLALLGIQRRGASSLLENMVLGAYAWAGDRRLDWGAGGPERWPLARPYDETPDGEDQRGFRIFEWYLAISKTVLHDPLPVILLAAGARPGDSGLDTQSADLSSHARRNLALAELMADGGIVFDPVNHEILEPVPEEVLACNFWLLSAATRDRASQDAWFRPDGTTLPVVGTFWSWLASRNTEEQESPELPAAPPPEETEVYFDLDDPIESQPVSEGPETGPLSEAASEPEEYASAAGQETHPPEHTPSSAPPVSLTFNEDKPKIIAHYLLLPTYEWGVSDWHLEVIRPYVRSLQPTIGYSIEEASHAWRVTVIGGPGSYPEGAIAALRQAGCVVEEIGGDGINIASQLADLSG